MRWPGRPIPVCRECARVDRPLLIPVRSADHRIISHSRAYTYEKQK